jgi:uncharacterized protein
MPANLPPQYYEAEKRFRAAGTPEEKIEALQSMLAIMPKHKGTDHLHAELRRRIARLTEEAERRFATNRASYYIRKEGAGQVVLIGLPNTGKSQLLAAVTDALPDIADYPYTTKTPLIGMMKFENILIQIVDMPAVTGHGARVWINNVARNADLIAIVVDLIASPVEQAGMVIDELASMGIVPVTRSINEEGTGLRQRKMVILGNKSDIDNAGVRGNELKKHYDPRFPVINISAKKDINLEILKKGIFNALDIVRVHTKTPGIKADLSSPIAMKKGSTVKDAAESIHKDFKAKLKYAVVWGSGKFDGQRVSQEHILQDNDIIEFHI